MREDSYLNSLYPLQDRILQLIGAADNSFYLTGGTVLSRAYLNHRFSDDLDFFVNNDETYKEQVEHVFHTLQTANITVERAVVHEAFTRLYIHEESCSLKMDFVNDVDYRAGNVIETPLFARTDTMRNILSNKLTALGRLEAKDVVDIIYIARNLSFNWKEVFEEAKKKDMWVNPVNAAELLERFPVKKAGTIIWKSDQPDAQWIQGCLKIIIDNILTGDNNTLMSER
jgi:predicted nucleotidyltransferase component of viral defense system